MRTFFSVIFWILMGGVGGGISAACVAFIYHGYALANEGISPQSMPLDQLLLDRMDIPQYAVMGAAIGAVLGLLSFLPALFRWMRQRNAPEDPGPLYHDVDAKIRSMRAERADAYLEKRRREEGPAGESVST